MVSVVDPRYVFGRSVFVRWTYALLISSVGEPLRCPQVFGTRDGDYQSTIIIYRYLYPSDMCSCRACSTNTQYSATSRVWDAPRSETFHYFISHLTDPLRIQPWSQDRRNQTRSNREHFRRKESRETDRRNGQESRQQRTSSPGRDTEEIKIM